jgi:hypothetical protein
VLMQNLEVDWIAHLSLNLTLSARARICALQYSLSEKIMRNKPTFEDDEINDLKEMLILKWLHSQHIPH